MDEQSGESEEEQVMGKVIGDSEMGGTGIPE